METSGWRHVQVPQEETLAKMEKLAAEFGLLAHHAAQRKLHNAEKEVQYVKAVASLDRLQIIRIPVFQEFENGNITYQAEEFHCQICVLHEGKKN